MTSSGARVALAMLTTLAVAACAARPLKLYTLNDAAAIEPQGQLRPGAPVMEVDRLTLPDYVDTVDILLRSGSVLERSDGARWASRLSILATNLLTARLATRAPDALVTDQWHGTAPDYRIMVQVTRLDVTTAGVASLNADWQIIPRDPQRQAIRDRTQIRITGPVATDQEVVDLETGLFEQLAGAIRLPSAR
ncbi:MAG: PqiC family protein [Steroidobacteraceae bacterium]